MLACLLFLSSCLHENLPSIDGETDPVYFIDAHSQVDDELADMDTIITRMDENNVKKTILAARGGISNETILSFANDNNTRIIASIRTKGGQYRNNSQSFYDDLEADSTNEDYGAIAELLSYHDAKEDNGAPEVGVLLSDARIQAALEVAQDNNWPFVVHIEFGSLNAADKDSYWADLKTLLDDNPDTPIVLIHMGQLDSGEVRELITAHSNIYFMTSHTDPVTVDNSVEPWTALFSNGSLKSEWKLLMTEHPTRFIFAIDNVWARHWGNRYGKVMAYWKDAMNSLPEDVANQIAHSNAERLWGLSVE